jgi:alpha-amylase
MIAPARGGALFAIDDRRRCFCITDVLTRRPEAYHAKVLELAAKDATGAPASGDAPAVVGAVTHVKDARLAEILVYDPHQRLAFVDQFFPVELELDDLRRCRAAELGTFKTSAYDLVELQRGTGRLTLRCAGQVRGPAGAVAATIRKTIVLEGAELRVEYELSPGSPLRGVYFASEISLALPSGPAPSGQCRVLSRDGDRQDHVATAGSTPEVSRVELHDSSSEMTITLTPSPAALTVRFPLETVSQSESGIERTYQGSTLVFLWRCELGAGESLRPALRLHVS